jgi:hypothetical protein
MKRSGWIYATVFSVFLTGIAFTPAGWLGTRTSQSSPPHGLTPHPKAPASFADPAARQWLRGEPTHWRAYMLQR